jgi:restriction endonuclease Mrr
LADSRGTRQTLREWLAENARGEAVHYKDIAEELGRDPASVSASLSIEKAQAETEGRPPYFVRVRAGLYRYNELCEAARDEEKVDEELREKAKEVNRRARSDINEAISRLDLDGFAQLANDVLANIRVRVEDVRERDRYNGTVVLTGSWLDDGGEAPVVFYVKRCGLNEPIGKETILEIRGILPKYQANQGVLISNGICTTEAREEAVQSNYTVPPVHIMDKEIILNILFESRIAVKSHKIEIFLRDDEYFDQLSNENTT